MDLQAIGHAIEKAVAPPQVESTLGRPRPLRGLPQHRQGLRRRRRVQEGEILLRRQSGPGIGLVSALTRSNGSATLNGVIQAKTSELATAILDRFDATQRQLTQIGLLIASDYGKLSSRPPPRSTRLAAASHLPSPTDALRLATQRFYYRR